MKKRFSLSFLALLLVFGSCQNKDLCFDHIGVDPNAPQVDIDIHWDGIPNPPVSHGMRINLFSLDGNKAYGLDDVPHTGTTVALGCNTIHRTMAYSYTGNNIYFRQQLNCDLIEAYCSTQTRTTYTRAYPDETTYAEPSGTFFVGTHPSYTVLDTRERQVIDIYPQDKLVTYTFEVRKVRGAQNITATRGAIAGMSSSYYIGLDKLAETPSTILFNAGVDVEGQRITGSFKTFGRLETTNNFSIEILFPSKTSGILLRTWDVTWQISGVNADNYHIIVDLDYDIPGGGDEDGEDTGNWEVDVNDWENINVPLK